MRSRVLLPAMFVGFVVAVPLLAACGDDDQGVRPDATVPTTPTGTAADVVVPPNPDSSGPDGGGGGLLFTDFVKGLITNETKPDNLPTTVDDKKFAPDPQDPKAFPASFF